MTQPLPTLVRAASLSGFAELALACGLRPAELLRGFALTPAMLENPDARVPLDAVVGVLERAAQQSGCEDFGLRLAANRHISNLGAVGLLIMLQPDLRAALLGVIERRLTLNGGLTIQLEESNGIAVLTFDLMLEGGQPSRQSVELITCVLVRLLRLFLGPDWMPRRLLLRHPAPLDDRLHQRLLGPCLEFSSEANAIVLPSRELDQPIASADPGMADYVKQHMLPERQQGAVKDDVKQLLFVMLPSGRVSIDHVARQLGLTRRTLQRRLDSEGVVFHDLLQAMRVDLAQQYVEKSVRSMGDVALLLGFSCASAFSRWHRTSFGEPAEARRRAHL